MARQADKGGADIQEMGLAETPRQSLSIEVTGANPTTLLLGSEVMRSNSRAEKVIAGTGAFSSNWKNVIEGSVNMEGARGL